MDKKMLIILLKSAAIFFAVMTVLFLMVKIKPLPKGTGFDGLEYVLFPFYAAVGCAIAYLVMAIIRRDWEKRLFSIAIGAGCLFVILLILSA